METKSNILELRNLQFQRLEKFKGKWIYSASLKIAIKICKINVYSNDNNTKSPGHGNLVLIGPRVYFEYGNLLVYPKESPMSCSPFDCKTFQNVSKEFIEQKIRGKIEVSLISML
jgi:cellobiose-specific phosphotransferase system component IIB